MKFSTRPGSALLVVLTLLIIAPVAGFAQLSGTYTIGGSSPNYATFAAAVTALTTSGVNGPVVFNVRAGTYTEQISIPAITGTSGTNTITFQSETGTASSVTLTFAATLSTANWVIYLNGTDHLRIKNMTLSSGGLGTSYRNVLRIDGTSNSVADLIVQGNIFNGWPGYSGSSDLALINEVPNSSASTVTISNNTFNSGSYGVYLIGNGSSLGTGFTVNANTFNNSAGYGGIYMSNQLGPVVDSNTVNVMYDAIDLNNCGNIGAGSPQLSVQRNMVVNTNGGYGISASSCNGNLLGSGLVANNFVTIQGGGGNGIYLSSSSYLNVYYNSVNIITSTASSNAFYQYSGDHQKIINNVFMNLTGGYAYYVYSPSAITLSDHNDLYSVGMQYLAYWGGTYAGDLAALQAAAAPNDANSVSANPNFTSSTDLHVNSPWLDGTGQVVSGVTTDIFGTARSGSTPDIGAVEFTASLTKMAGGTYTIGGGGSYASFAAAAGDLNTRGIAGAVTFNVRAAGSPYSEQVDLAPVAGSSGTNTVTFQSESGVASTVTLRFTQSQSDASNNFVFRLNGSSHVRIKNMTLVAFGLGTSYRSVLVLDGNVNDVAIQGDSLSGFLGYSGAQSLALLTGSSLLTSNLTITGNGFGSSSYGIYLTGYTTASESGTIIKGNRFSNAAGYGGIYLSNHLGPVVDSNIVNVTYDAIDLNNCGNTGAASPQLSVQKNIIVNTNGGYGINISSGNGNLLGSGLVANNIISIGGSNGANGIYVSSSSYLNVYYNSVNITTSAASNAFYQYSGDHQNIVNNIFMNLTGGYAYYVYSPSAITLSDHNDLYSIGMQYLAYWGGTYAADLAALQAAAAPNDANSVSANPGFASATDLHVGSPWIDGAGMVVAGVTTDIFGTARSGSTPDIGAVEFTASLTKMAGGTYTIGGASPSYPTFAAAVTALTTRGITGAVTFNARAGMYSEQVDLAPVPGVSGTNTVTFQSESGVMSDVTLQFSQSQSDASKNYLFRLNGASHVRIKNMTLVSYGLGTSYRSVLVLNGNVNDVAIQGDSLSGFLGYSGAQSLALLTGSSLLTSNLTITGNRFGSSSYGIYLTAYTTASESGTIIKQNTFNNLAGYGGIYLSNHLAPVIDSNLVYVAYDAIDLNSCGDVASISPQLSVQANKIVSSNGGYGINISSCNGNALGSGLVANNFVSLGGSNGASGIYVSSSSYLNVYYNSVNITTSSTSSYSLYQYGGDHLNIVDNIFLNETAGYACYIYTPGAITRSDFNRYFTTGTNLAHWGSTDYATLSLLVAATSMDSSSSAGGVYIVSPTDLHLTGPSIGDRFLLGTSLADVTTDIDGEARHPNPYVGADEASVALSVKDHQVAGKGIELAPVQYKLLQNYPNPFNPETMIKFSVEKAGRTTLEVYDIIGQRVATLFDQYTEPGQYYQVRFNGVNLASGVYFYRVQSGSWVDLKKLVLLK